jgi:uncharacterized repeat protein (TIGR01451 family)
MKKRSRSVVARISLVMQFVALAVLAASPGMSLMERTADAATAATGALLKTVNLPASVPCTTGGSVQTLVAGRMVGQQFANFPILLAVGCSGDATLATTRTISFLDPNSAGATTSAGATVVATIVTSTAPSSGGWRSLAVRPDRGDLIGCGNSTIPSDGFSLTQSEVHSIPIGISTGTTANVIPTLLFTNGLNSGDCDGLTWDSSDKTIYAAPTGASTIYHFNPASATPGTPVGTFGGPCPGPIIEGLMLAGSSIFVTCPGTTVYQINKTTGANISNFTTANAVDGMGCDPYTFAPSGNSAMWARDNVTYNKVYALALPQFQCGVVAGGAIVPNGPECLGGVINSASSSGDGLLDCWKTQGIDVNGDGAADFQLPGAIVGHHDVYLEIDSYSSGCPSTTSCVPPAAAISSLVAAFAAAPVANTVGGTGVALHVLAGGDSMAVTGSLALPPCTQPAIAGSQDFDALKRQYFGTLAERTNVNGSNILAAKAYAVHYMISAPSLQGLGSTSGCSELPGNDFAIALGGWNFTATQLAPSWGGTIMHEFGHNLGLRHGGGAAIDTDTNGNKLSANCKPNYISVMSYAQQMPDRPVPLANWKLDYSRLQLPTLNEGALNESVGVFGTAANQSALSGLYTAFGVPTKTGGTQVTIASASTAINFNGDRTDPSFEIVSDNANSFGTSGCDGSGASLAGFNDWANLVYAFQTTLDFGDGVHNTTVGPDNTEITQEQSNAIFANTTPYIALTKELITPQPVVLGSNVTYKITASNVGPKPATHVNVVDTLPTGMSFVSASAPAPCSQATDKSTGRVVVTCPVGSLAIGASTIVTIVGKINAVPAGDDGVVIINQAAVSSDPDTTFFQTNATLTGVGSNVTTQVQYAWSGFNQPIYNPPAINQVQAGSTIPVKFSLGGDVGKNIFVNGSPQSQQVNCGNLPGTVTLIGSPLSVTPAGLAFNLVTAPNQYLFSWQTNSAWAGTCRQLSVQLNDGTPPHVAYFKFV